MKIYTRKGDDGSTGLLFGGRVAKDDLRTQACGAIDEAVAALGLARSLGPQAKGLAEYILSLQRSLFVVGAEVATAIENSPRLTDGVSRVTSEMVQELESSIDDVEAVSPLPDRFIVPGETPVAAALDLSRSIVRRAERAVVTLSRSQQLEGDAVLRFLNRLSDFLFVLARFEESSVGLQAPSSRE